MHHSRVFLLFSFVNELSTLMHTPWFIGFVCTTGAGMRARGFVVVPA
jgi:hypothetical protein